MLEFFSQFGEVKYLRMTSHENDVIKSALIEFTDQSSVANALQSNPTTFNGSQLLISHATTAILKPEGKETYNPAPTPIVADIPDVKVSSQFFS